jgi:hypothetical protein
MTSTAARPISEKKHFRPSRRPTFEQNRPPPVQLQKHKNYNRPSRRLGYPSASNFFSSGILRLSNRR